MMFSSLAQKSLSVISSFLLSALAELLVIQDNEPGQGAKRCDPGLGGIYNVATVVDDLIDRVMADPRLNANPRVDEAHHRVSAAGFKYLVTELACPADRWTTEVYRSFDERLPPASHDHCGGMGGFYG